MNEGKFDLHVGTMNDGLFIIDRAPRPAPNDFGPANGPTAVIATMTNNDRAASSLAHQFVAAADLLAALKAIVTEIRAYQSPECDDEGAPGAAELKAADAAIAKAEGRAR